jgi:hypothetical protein
MKERLDLASEIMARLLSCPTFRVNGQPWSSDTDLPEIAEAAVNAADALLLACKTMPINEGLIKHFGIDKNSDS